MERLKKVGHAMIDLQRVSNVSNSMGMNVATVNLQPLEHNIWDSVDEVNTYLDWLQGTSDICSGWENHFGGLGSSEGGNMFVWEGVQDSDSKFLRGFDNFLG